MNSFIAILLSAVVVILGLMFWNQLDHTPKLTEHEQWQLDVDAALKQAELSMKDYTCSVVKNYYTPDCVEWRRMRLLSD